MSFLKVKRNTIYELRRKGLPIIRLGRSVRFEKDEVIKWVRTNCYINPQSEKSEMKQNKMSPKETALPVPAALINNENLAAITISASSEYLL